MYTPESRFLEIGIKKTRVTIKTEQVINMEREESEITEHSALDEPLDSFTEALQSLVGDVLGICELDDGYAIGMSVSKVVFNYSKDGIMGACIVASKKLSDTNAGYVNLTTPNCPQFPYNEYSTWCMTAEMAKRLALLQDEATKYLAGQRKVTQQELPGLSEARQAANGVRSKAAEDFMAATREIAGDDATIDVTRDAQGGTVVSIGSIKSKGF